MVSVGGHKLHFVLYRGKVPVTVLLEAGGGSDLTSWAAVPRMLAHQTGATVVAYDRAGLGGSEPGSAESTPDDEIRHLHAALSGLKVPGKTIVVAHSYGAMLALLSAGRHPSSVAGLVLVDPMNTRFIEATGDFIFSTVPKIDRPIEQPGANHSPHGCDLPRPDRSGRPAGARLTPAHGRHHRWQTVVGQTGHRQRLATQP